MGVGWVYPALINVREFANVWSVNYLALLGNHNSRVAELYTLCIHAWACTFLSTVKERSPNVR